MERAELLSIYVNNSSEVYLLTEWLENCIAKKIRKGVAVDTLYLSQCSTMKKIISKAARIEFENEGIKPSKEERSRVALSHAAQIIENARYIAGN